MIGIPEIFIIALALSLDAFAVSISCGIKLNHIQVRKYVKIALFFGFFQALMPLAGWACGYFVAGYISDYAGWLAFSIFLFLGFKTILDSTRKKKCDPEKCSCNNITCLMSLSLATSIDAFIIGLVFALMKVPLLLSVIIIGTITFIMSVLGCLIGNKSANLMGRWAGLVSGLILLGLALKIAAEKIF